VAADRNNVQGGTGGAVRTGAGDCLKTGAGGGSVECGSGSTATAAGGGGAAPSAGSAMPATAAGAAGTAVAGPAGVTGAGHDATTGHLRDGHGSPVRTGNGECVNLGFSVGQSHPADCVVQAPVAKTPEPPAAAPTAAVPPPEKVAEPAPEKVAEPAPAPEPVAVVPAQPEGVNADSVTDPTTKWSKEGAAQTAKSYEGPTVLPQDSVAGTSVEAPPAGVAQAEAPYPAPTPQFPEVETPAAVAQRGPLEDAPPYEVPGPNVGGQPDVALVPTDPQVGMIDEGLDPVTKWSKQGAAGQGAKPMEGSTQLPADSVAGTSVAAPPQAVAQAPADLKTPDPYQAPTSPGVPAPEQIPPAPPVQPPAPPPAPEKVQAPEYEKYVLSADVLFKFDRYTRKYMLPDGKKQLDELAAKLNTYTGVKEFDVIGHTDRIGSHKYNDRLSLRRAATVKQYLTEKGVDANLMKISGKGKREPVVQCPGKRVTKKLKACLQPNRRVEVEVRGEQKK
jgi:OOP family OmpA-OmpF porin